MNAVIASAGLWLSESGDFTISTAPVRSVRAATGRPGPGQPPRQVPTVSSLRPDSEAAGHGGRAGRAAAIVTGKIIE